MAVITIVALRDYGDVLNVRVTARRSLRIQRIQEDEGLQASEARARLDRMDEERSKYIGAYYGLNWTDAVLYDLVVNTGRLSPDSAVELILQALSLMAKDRDPDLPLVRDAEPDLILDRATSEAIRLLDATTRNPRP